MCPRHRAENNEPVSIHIAKSIDQDAGFRNLPNAATDYWRCAELLVWRWSYVYPWFGGGASEIFFNVGVYKRKDAKTYKNTNFLQPRGFENALSNYLDNQYGFQYNSDGPLFQGPIEWRRRNDLPISAVEFWIKGSRDSCILAFPVTERHFVIIRSAFMSHDKQMQEQADPLVRQILDSVKITLATETLAKWERVKAENPGVQVSISFAPLKWPVKPEDIT
jgi:hypothetical protein